MPDSLSPRLRAVVDALPLRPGLRVLEIGGAPGSAARAIAERVAPDGHILVLDRSQAGIERTRRVCADEIDAARMSTLCAPVENFRLPAGDPGYDLAFACRVGALDGRHPQLTAGALGCLRAALRAGGQLFLDTGEPMRCVDLD